MDILSSSSSYPTSPSASVRWLIVSIPHSSPFQVDARGTAAASLLVLLFLPPSRPFSLFLYAGVMAKTSPPVLTERSKHRAKKPPSQRRAGSRPAWCCLVPSPPLSTIARSKRLQCRVPKGLTRRGAFVLFLVFFLRLLLLLRIPPPNSSSFLTLHSSFPGCGGSRVRLRGRSSCSVGGGGLMGCAASIVFGCFAPPA